eukprot:597891_1
MARKLPKIVTVEGIIGSGKTTLLTRLQQQLPHHKVKFVPEPIESWENAEKFKPMPSHFMKFNETFPTNPFSMNDSNGVNGCANHDQFELLSKMYSDPSRWCLSFQLGGGQSTLDAPPLQNQIGFGRILKRYTCHILDDLSFEKLAMSHSSLAYMFNKQT